MTTVDRKKKPFSEKELQKVGEKAAFFPGRPPTPILNTPISYRENAMSLFWDKKPCFAVSSNDFGGLTVGWYQKHLGRASRAEGSKIDAFGVEWVYEPTAGGSISVAGNPRFEDVNDWKDIIQMPSLDDWDWAADAEKNVPDLRFSVEMTATNGFWFERLISLMDFVNAAMALVDDDQWDAIHELFEATTALACDFVDRVCDYWPALDGFIVHDDWGSQRDPFFSDDIARELFLPHMQKLVSHIHSKGRYMGLHSCGHVEARVPIFIEAGIDTWQMQANATPNIAKLYEEMGDKICFQITVPEFDLNDEKAAIQTVHDYVDNFCKPGKPTMLVSRTGFGSRVFAEELLSYSRKHFLNQ